MSKICNSPFFGERSSPLQIFITNIATKIYYYDNLYQRCRRDTARRVHTQIAMQFCEWDV